MLSVTEKEGRSGRLTFVTLGHRIRQGHQVVIDERQDVVYREAASPRTRPATGPDVAQSSVPAGEDEWEIEVSPTMLFRFSALTYNAHRIHYDRDYARDAEGYPGLLTHGPLQALAMAEAAREGTRGNAPTSATFEYRLLSPLFDHQGMLVRVVRGREGTVTSVRDRCGRQTAAWTLRNNGR